MPSDRGAAAPSRNVNLRNGTKHDDASGSLRKCDNPGCATLYTTRKVCRDCQRETVPFGGRD